MQNIRKKILRVNKEIEYLRSELIAMYSIKKENKDFLRRYVKTDSFVKETYHAMRDKMIEEYEKDKKLITKMEISLRHKKNKLREYHKRLTK